MADTHVEGMESVQKDLDEAAKRIAAAQKRLTTVDRRYKQYMTGAKPT